MGDIAVSVVIPVYNGEIYLHKCLDSVIDQTLNAIEIIIVNDASTDNSQRVIDDYAGKDNRIIAVEFKENMGVSTARNVGLEKVTGDCVIFLDADDYWLDNGMLTYLYDLGLRNKADLVLFGFERSDAMGKVVDKWAGRAGTVDLRRSHDWSIMHTTWAHLISMRLIRKHEFRFEPSLVMGEDALFNHALYCYASRLTTTDKIFYRHTTNMGSATHGSRDRQTLFCTVQWFEQAIELVKNSPAFRHRPELLQILIFERLTMLVRKLAIMSLKFLNEEEQRRFIQSWARCFEHLDHDYFDHRIYPNGWPDLTRRTLDLVMAKDTDGLRRQFSDESGFSRALRWCKRKLGITGS